MYLNTFDSLLCLNHKVSAIFEVLDNLLDEDNMESFEILEDVGAGQRVLNNTERYALYVAQVLQDQGMNTVINRAGENIGQCYSLAARLPFDKKLCATHAHKSLLVINYNTCLDQFCEPRVCQWLI